MYAAKPPALGSWTVWVGGEVGKFSVCPQIKEGEDE